MPRFRASIIWLAAIFVVAGATIGFANAGDEGVEDPTEQESIEAVDKEAKPDKAARSAASEEVSGEHKENHGLFVSQAAHCEDVDDPATPESPDFEAPEDCTGSAHGEYVSSVAKSSVGKKDKDKPKNGS